HRAGEYVHLGAALGQPPGHLDDIHVQPARVARPWLLERRLVKADHCDPPGQASQHGHTPPEGEPRALPSCSRCSPWPRRSLLCRSRPGPVPSLAAPLGSGAMGTVILLRHGESTWNAEGLFTGWVDVPLSPTGTKEAAAAGQLLADAGARPDVLYTSLLTRSIQTANLALETAGWLWLPVRRSWRLNERHYGALQGKDKAQTRREFGDEQFM